jgi:molybdopterin converting factor subunit 1
MTVRVQMFARAKELAGAEVVELSFPHGATVADVRRKLAAEAPTLAQILPHCMFAVNMEYAGDETAIPPGAAVACVPPVSGG